MAIEQTLPHKPNFFMIVLMVCGCIILFFLATIAYLHWNHRHTVPGQHNEHPTTQLTVPPPLHAAALPAVTA